MQTKKRVTAIVTLAVLSFSLCGCSTFVPLSERAVIKGIYLDAAGGEVQAALVVYTCTPSANTAEVQGKAQIYTGEGETIEQALAAAEKKQNKKTFYAQNRLLILGPHTFDTVSGYLSYFGMEEVSRANLSVFLTNTTREKFVQLEEKVSRVVEEGERLTQENVSKGNKACGIHEVRYDANGLFYGYLPILQMNADEFTGVEELMLYGSGTPICTLQGLVMQMALLLSDKANSLVVTRPIEGTQTVLHTQHLFLQRETDGKGMLCITLCGKIKSLTQNGRELKENAAQRALQQCNGMIDSAVQQLIYLTIQQGNDVFAWDWWVDGKINEVRLQSRIRMA